MDDKLELEKQNVGSTGVEDQDVFLGILTLESGTAYDFAIDYSQVYPGPSGMGSELVTEAYAAGVEEDNCYHSSLIQLEAGLERENGAGSGHSCACAGRRRRRRPVCCFSL